MNAIGSAISRLIIFAGVGGHPKHRRHALMQRGGSGTFQDSNDGEIGSDADEGMSYLDRGSSQGKRLSPIDL